MPDKDPVEAWRVLHERFLELRREEDTLAYQTGPNQWMHAFSDGNGFWTIANVRSEILEARFLVCATEAGLLVAGVDAGARPMDTWLSALFIYFKDRDSNYVRAIVSAATPHGALIFLSQASATYSAILQRKEMERRAMSGGDHLKAEVMEATRDSMEISKPPRKTPFPHRATWLQDRLRERSWDQNTPRGFGGPDRKTVLRMLGGLQVTEDSLYKIVLALNKTENRKKIELLDIPND